ncbi:MAG: hypothetical protein JW873_02480, partial [Candidatus Saganbacteria bacterium]|nr:hypothetical protein [Candidatus Saganbacteria bacterium]
SKERADKLWDAMLHSKNSLYKLIEARKMQFACPVTPPPPLKPGKVSVSGVTPYNVKPGDEVEFALTGEGLNLVTGVDSPTGFPDLVQSEIGPDGNLKFNVPEISPDGKRLKFQKVSVPYGVKPGEYEFTLKGGDNADKKVTSFKVKVVATDTRTSLEKAGDYAANTLKAKGELAVGLSKYPWQSQDVPYNLRSLGDREMPNLKADLRLGSIDDPVSIVGRGKAIVPVSEHAELLGNVQTGTRDAVHNGPDTYQLSGALGLGVRGNIWTTPQLRLLSAGVYAEGSVNGNANSAPNKFFYNGTDKNLNLRLTLDSEFGGVFAERQYTAFNWDNNSFPGGFSGHTEKWQLGLLGNVDLKKNQWAPKIYLKAAWLVSGKTAVPDAMADFAYEELSGVEAAARVDFKKFPKLPFYFYGGLQRLSQDGYNWGTLSRYFAGAGVKRPDIGTVELRGDLGDNPALYYGGGFKMGTLAYTLPEKLRQASGLTLKAQLYEFGKQTGFNGVAALDLVPLIFGPIKTSPLQTEK